MTDALIVFGILFIVGVWMGVACMWRDQTLGVFGQGDYDAAQMAQYEASQVPTTQK